MRYLLLLCWLWPLFATAQSPVPYLDEAPFARAEAAFRDERYEQAIPIYDSLLRVLPRGTDRYAVAATRVARCHIDLGDYPKALPPLRQAVAYTTISPTLRADALLELGFALWLKGRPDSLILCAQQAATLLPADVHPSLHVRKHYYQAIGYDRIEEDNQSLQHLREAERIVQQHPNDITAYDQARVYSWLTTQYESFGWEKSRKNALNQLQRTLADLPKQEVRWGHVVLDGYGLFEYPVGDSLTQRLEQVYSRRLGLGSIGRAFALNARLGFTALPADKLQLLDKATAAAKIHFGAQSYQVTTYMASRTWPLYNNNYADSAIINEKMVYQRRWRHGGYNKGARAVMLLNLEGIYRLKGDIRTSNLYLDSLIIFVQQQYPENSTQKALLYQSIINNKLKNDDIASASRFLDDYQQAIHTSVGDSSTLMIDYYLLAQYYYQKIGNNNERIRLLSKADSLIIDALGPDANARIQVLYDLGDIQLRARQWDRHSATRAEERRLLLLNRQNNSSWVHNYKYNIGYSFLAAVLQNKYAEADALLIQFEQALSPDDPDYATHLSECASLASLVKNQNAYIRFLRLAEERINEDKKQGKYNLSAHLSITDLMAEYYLKQGECDAAANYLDISRHLSIQHNSPNDPDILLKFARNDLDLCQCRGCDQKTIINLQEKQLALQQRIDKINFYLYGNLAYEYRSIGAFERAKLYETQALSMYRESVEKNNTSPLAYVEYLMQKGLYATDTLEIVTCYLQADSIAQKHQLPIAWIHGRLLKHYSDQGQYQQAVYWGEKLPADYQSERMNSQDSLNQTLHYTNLGLVYWLYGNSAQSNKYYQLAYDLLTQTKCSPNDAAKVYERLSFWRRTQGDYSGAIDFGQRGLQLMNVPLSGAFEEAKVATQPALVRDLYHRIARAYGIWYDATSTIAYNDSAYLYANYALRTLQAQNDFAYSVDPNVLQNRHDGYTKFTFEEHFKALSIRNKITQQPNQVREAFTVNELWRAPAFRQELQERRTEKASVIARKMRENALAIDKNQALKFEAEQAGRPVSYYSDVLVRLDALYKEQERLRKDYASSRSKSNLNQTATIEQLQAQLSKEHTYLSFFLTDSMLTTIVVRPDTFLLIVRKGDMSVLQKAAAGLRQEIITPKYNKVNLAQSAAILSDSLLRPVERWLSTNLVIVPDDALSGIPFELLHTKHVLVEQLTDMDMKKWPMMLFNHQIVYAQSATIWLDMIQRKQRPTNDLLAMAPSYAGLNDDPEVQYWQYDPLSRGTRSGLLPLKYTRQEIEEVARALGRANPILYKGIDAKSAVFIREAPKSKIIHLALHAKAYEASGDYSYLVFAYPDSIQNIRVFARDIARMRFQADMVVLSGCETGAGRQFTGEGIVGLGRAFAVAGAKSIVVSLWQVDDKTTSVLMTQYYKNLKEGQRKDKAMNDARQTLIAEDYAPFFWAPFVVYGDASPIKF
jgi:CHAT domain-containing protein